MNRSKVPHYLLLGALVALGIASAQTKVKQVPAKPTVSVDGKVLYRDYCAACHGADAKGSGPAASALKPPPTDLTQIARNHNGKFPEEQIMKILTGEETLTAHGNKEMPVWGAVFNNMNASPSMTQMRLHALLQYLEDLQAK